MNLIKIYIVTVFFLCFQQQLLAQAPELFLQDFKRVEATKFAAKNNIIIQENIKQLSQQADKLLSKTYSSVMDKKVLPPCGNKHEYFSLAKYFWYDSSKPNGIPYIRKDGQKNPEVDKISDDKNFDNLIGAVHTLAWAYYFTDDKKYADKATQLIRFWFLDTATMMFPNLNHAQLTTGSDTGRGSGIIDTHNLPWVLDAIGLLRTSNTWKEADEKGIKQWFNSYLDWMITSKNGKHESKTTNNHKTFYENQIACIALFCNKENIAATVFENAKKTISTPS